MAPRMSKKFVDRVPFGRVDTEKMCDEILGFMTFTNNELDYLRPTEKKNQILTTSTDFVPPRF